MKKTYETLDFDSADSLAHEVTHLLSKNNLHDALEGHLCAYLQQWYDALDLVAQKSLHACIKVYFGRAANADYLTYLDSYQILRELMTEVHEKWPELLLFIPDAYRLVWKDVETKQQSIIRSTLGFFNAVLSERETSREWLQDCLSFRDWGTFPALEARDPQEIGQLLDAGNLKDLTLVENIQLLFEDLATNNKWATDVFAGMYSAFEAKYLELPLPEALDHLTLWSDRFAEITGQQLPAISEATLKKISESPVTMDSLDAQQATDLIYCADHTKQWESLPACLHMALFNKLLPEAERKLQFLNSMPGKCLSYVPKAGQPNPAKDPRHWLSRPEADLYTETIFNRVSRQSPEDCLKSLDQIAKCKADYSPLIQEHLDTEIRAFAASITKLPLTAANDLLGTTYLAPVIDLDELAGIHLGRMRQHAKGSEPVNFPLYFGRAYQRVLEKAPLKAFTRLADAIIAAEIPIAEEDLCFSDDINELYLMPIYPHLKHYPTTPGTWLMKQLFEWIFRFIPDLVAVERGLLTSHRHGDLTLNDVRSTWAELCWRKLDIKKTAKNKPAGDLTSGDQLEPRSTWRIAHLKSLGDLGDDLGNKAHRRIHAIAKNDPEEDVREVAAAVYNKTLRERMKSADNPLYSFIKVTLWFRVANRESLGLGIDEKAATRSRNQELRLAKAFDEQSM